MFRFIKELYREITFYVCLIKIYFQQNKKSYFNFKENLINVLFTHYDYNNFKTVNSGISKYISVFDKEEQQYRVALNFGSYDYMSMSNIKLPNDLDNLISCNCRTARFNSYCWSCFRPLPQHNDHRL